MGKPEDFSGRHPFSLRLRLRKCCWPTRWAEIADGIFQQSPEGMALSLAWLGALAFTGQILILTFPPTPTWPSAWAGCSAFTFWRTSIIPILDSITEFWRRWHISLSSWFRDYVYIPWAATAAAGASRSAISVVWLLTGLWHGANWTFIAWGLWFGLLLLGEKFLWGSLWNRLPAFPRHLSHWCWW